MRARPGAQYACALLVGALALGACGGGGPFADLPPRVLPAGVDALATADGWTVTDGGVLAEGGGTFALVVPEDDVPATGDGGATEIVYHLDRVEPDGTTLETVDLVAVTVTPQGAPAETMVLPADPGVHYDLFAEVARADGTYDRYQEWLYVP